MSASNVTQRAILTELLHRWGASVEDSADASEAASTIQSAQASGRPFDVILLDLGLGTFAVADRIREFTLSDSSRIVILSAPLASGNHHGPCNVDA